MVTSGKERFGELLVDCITGDLVRMPPPKGNNYVVFESAATVAFVIHYLIMYMHLVICVYLLSSQWNKRRFNLAIIFIHDINTKKEFRLCSKENKKAVMLFP